ncbi:hypothetical protein ASG03_00900 [Rhizobium sp. Leaf341]|nr:hypothetical protein ASG03_00900 [Rhizobium sp. Leaf341]
MSPPELPLPGPSDPSYERAKVIELEQRIADLELNSAAGQLSHEYAHRALLIAEVKQRIRVRYAAFIISMITMAFMGFVLLHAVHNYFWGPFVLVPPSVAIAMFVAPTVSISAITIMLLVGAFRRFKDDDMDNIHLPSITAEAVKSSILN